MAFDLAGTGNRFRLAKCDETLIARAVLAWGRVPSPARRSEAPHLGLALRAARKLASYARPPGRGRPGLRDSRGLRVPEWNQGIENRTISWVQGGGWVPQFLGDLLSPQPASPAA